MKYFLRILTFLFISSLFVGCTNRGISPLFYRDKEKSKVIESDKESINLDYTIDKVTLSKNYQSIEPSIEMIKNGLHTNLLISLGIVNSSGITIDKIDRIDRDVNIHISNKDKASENQLVVPQVILHFEDLSSKEMEKLNFKIVNKNYEPIKANLDISEAISKIQSSLKISSSTFPNVEIKKENDNTFLNLSFENAVDLKNKNNPIINLDVLVDLTSGEIVKSTRNSVSSFIDKGTILDYISNKFIFYLQEKVGNEYTSYNLWVYDIENDKKEKFYTSKEKIIALDFNDKKDKAFLIKSSKNSNEIHLLELDNLKVNRLEIQEKINPSLATWKDDEIILVDKKNNNSKIYSFNNKDKKVKSISQKKGDIKQIDYFQGNYIYAMEDDNSKEIYITDDFKKDTLLDQGENPVFINKNTIAYLKNNNNNDKKTLWFYNIKNSTTKAYSDIDVDSIFIWKDNLAIIEKTPANSDNPIYIYDLQEENLEFLTSVKDDKIFLNTEKDLIYINPSISFNDNKVPVISFVDLKDIKTH